MTENYYFYTTVARSHCQRCYSCCQQLLFLYTAAARSPMLLFTYTAAARSSILLFPYTAAARSIVGNLCRRHSATYLYRGYAVSSTTIDVYHGYVGLLDVILLNTRVCTRMHANHKKLPYRTVGTFPSPLLFTYTAATRIIAGNLA